MRLSLAAILPLAILPQVWAWGAAGHEIVATIAQVHLHPDVRERLCGILPKEAQCRLASVAAWADGVRGRYRETGPMHYVNRECAGERSPSDRATEGSETASSEARMLVPQARIPRGRRKTAENTLERPKGARLPRTERESPLIEQSEDFLLQSEVFRCAEKSPRARRTARDPQSDARRGQNIGGSGLKASRPK